MSTPPLPLSQSTRYKTAGLVVQPKKIKFPKTIGPKYVSIIMPWLETYWNEHKRFPSVQSFIQEFGLSEQEVAALWNHKFFQRSLSRRGVPLPDQVDLHGNPYSLTDRQVAAIAILTNYHDSRSPVARLSMIGVTEQELQGWMNNSVFKETLRSRADEVFDNVDIDASINLAKRVKKGDLNAIKFYFEVTGRAQSPEAVNVKQAMQVLIEAVQKHVKDPAILEAIAEEVQVQRGLKGLT